MTTNNKTCEALPDAAEHVRRLAEDYADACVQAGFVTTIHCEAWHKMSAAIAALASTPAQPPVLDDTILTGIPSDVIAAERVVSGWFAERNMKHWQLGHSASRFVAQPPVAAVPEKRWPFVESPGEFASRLAEAFGEFRSLLAAVRHVLIEHPPTLATPTPAPAAQGEALPIELTGVAESLAQSSGFWASCSGCHELNEGYSTGAYSDVFKCALGNGCSECGGLGAVWDTTDYDAMAVAMSIEPAAPERAEVRPPVLTDTERLDWAQENLLEITQGLDEQFSITYLAGDGVPVHGSCERNLRAAIDKARGITPPPAADSAQGQQGEAKP